MKGILLFAGIAGVAIAIAITYLKGQGTGQVMNVEDGLPVEA